MYGYIYITTDLLTGKKYIGKHKASKFEFDTYKGSGTFIKEILLQDPSRLVTELLPSINGVATICESLEELNNSESYYIEYYNCVNSDKYYNRVPGGSGGIIYEYLDEETKKNRSKKISDANKQRWANMTQADIEDRSKKWRQSYFNISEEEKIARNKRNSEALKEYNRNRSEEDKLRQNQKLKVKAQLRLNDPEKEAERKRKEKITKSNKSEEEKLAYIIKQREQHLGQKYYTDGNVVIKCFPEEAPEGFYLGGAHRNNYRFIIYIDDQEFLGANIAAEYLNKNGYPKINYERIIKIGKEGLNYKGKYSELKGWIKIYDRT